ncbi:YfhO family protein, partial [Patescibacteria group bacterium]|nr:YfhO family protein [Patescibacteria group bacterium]
MKLLKSNFLPLVLLILLSLVFFKDFTLFGKLPIPADTIVGMYYPFRQIYSDTNPNGIQFKNFMVTDPVRQQYPWKELAMAGFKKGELPLWNPYNFTGYPLLANFQAAPFYPFNFLFFIFPFSLGWSIFILIQQPMAALFMFLFLRNLKLSKVSSFFGAVAFAFSGFFVSWLEWGNIVSTGLWLPLILLSIDKIFKNNKKYLAVLLLGLVSSFFAGHLQIFFYLSLISFAYFIFRLNPLKNLKKNIPVGLVFLMFLAITSIQSIPTLSFIAQSARGVDQDWHKEGWFIPLQNAIQFVAPDFFGNPATL